MFDFFADVTLSVYIHTGQAKILPGHGGNRTRDLWFASPMLCRGQVGLSVIFCN